MKKKNLILLLLIMMSVSSVCNASEAAQNRGLFAFITGSYVQVSWRMRATDDAKTTKYILYYGDASGSENTLIGTYTTKTTVRLESKTYKDKYFKIVVRDKNGNTIDTQNGVSVKDAPYLDIPLTAPFFMDEEADTVLISYTPGDCSAYDMDGDGEQEIILKWMAEGGTKVIGGKIFTPHAFYDCYKLNGKRLWRIDAGQNSNAGNNAAFFCWDFDGDGKGEMMIKSAPGTKDATGAYCGSAAHSNTGSDLPGYATDLEKFYRRGSDGLPTYGIWTLTDGKLTVVTDSKSYEWVTVFDGATGKELGSCDYWPYFNIQTNWNPGGNADGAGYGRRGCSQKGGVMKIPCNDGVTRPTACFQRGAYTYVYCTDFSWDGKTLKEEWRNASEAKTGNTNCSYREKNGEKIYKDISLYSEGAHPSEVADLDGDGYDELCIGAAALDHDGTVLWSTGLGHGDAVHVGELNPDNPGLEVWRITEGATTYDACMIDAKTGKVLNGQPYTKGDVSRGIAMDIDDSLSGCEYMYFGSPTTIYDANGNVAYTNTNGVMSNNGMPNYRIYFDGDLLDEHLTGTMVSKFSPTAQAFGRMCTFSSSKGSTIYHCSTINGTKANPCLQCDLFGDWREELVYYVAGGYSTLQSANGTTDYALRVVTSHYDTDYKLPWLRDDNTYNMEIACQNIGYSMPPHLGYSPVEYYGTPTFPEVGKYYTIKANGKYFNPSSISSGKVSASDTSYPLQFVASGDGYLIKTGANTYLADTGNYGLKLSSSGTVYSIAQNDDGSYSISSLTATSNPYLMERSGNNDYLRGTTATSLTIAVADVFEGDVDGDGNVTVVDVAKLIGNFSNLQSLGINTSIIDVDNNNEINLLDIEGIVSKIIDK